MKLSYSLFSRRKFLNSLLAAGMFVFLSSFLYPIIKFLLPLEREPDQVILKYTNYNNMTPYSARTFAWGNKPGILIKRKSQFHAFIAVCTHLDCTVSFLPEERRFYCACHDGWFDEYGVNVAGPPPTPLTQLIVELEGENLIIRKNGERTVT